MLIRIHVILKNMKKYTEEILGRSLQTDVLLVIFSVILPVPCAVLAKRQNLTTGLKKRWRGEVQSTRFGLLAF